MSPPPRPPSPGSRAATQRAMRRPNPNQLSSRDAQVLLLGAEKVKGDTVKENGGRVESFFPGDHIPSPIEIPKTDSYDTTSAKSPKSITSTVPSRPSRNGRNSISMTDSGSVSRLLVSHPLKSQFHIAFCRWRGSDQLGQRTFTIKPSIYGYLRLWWSESHEDS